MIVTCSSSCDGFVGAARPRQVRPRMVRVLITNLLLLGTIGKTLLLPYKAQYLLHKTLSAGLNRECRVGVLFFLSPFSVNLFLPNDFPLVSGKGKEYGKQ